MEDEDYTWTDTSNNTDAEEDIIAVEAAIEATEQDEDDDDDEIWFNDNLIVNFPSGVSISSTQFTAAAAAGSGNSHSTANANMPSNATTNADAAERTNSAGSNNATGSATTTPNNPSAATTAGDDGAKPSFYFGSSSFSLRSRKEVAALVNAECCQGGQTPDLDSIMDTLFHPGTAIDNPDNIEWVRWLIAGGRTPQEFVKIGKFLYQFINKLVIIIIQHYEYILHDKLRTQLT